MRKFITIRKWKTNYPNPIILEQNEIVEIVEKENDNPNWKKWFFCKKQNKLGWVPEQIINRIENKKGIVTENYSAKELNVNEGEKVKEIKELNGWVWVKRELNNDKGWLPLEILEKIE
jgi:hypothetical protein